MSRAVLNFWYQGEKLDSVEIDDAPIPRVGELIVADTDTRWKVLEVVHDSYASGEVVTAPEIIVKVDVVGPSTAELRNAER